MVLVSLLFLLFCFLGLARRGEERGVLVGERALRAAGRNRNQPHGPHAGTLSFTDPAGGNFFTLNMSFVIDVDFLLIIFSAFVFFVVTQVVCGQNCSFLLQSNGTVLAVGEGQYGRLGQGNSDDLYVPTIISAFQGISYSFYQCVLTITCVSSQSVKDMKMGALWDL